MLRENLNMNMNMCRVFKKKKYNITSIERKDYRVFRFFAYAILLRTLIITQNK